MNHPKISLIRCLLSVTVLAVIPTSLSAMKIIKKGDAVGVFYVMKIAGAELDGVKSGQRLCYRCRYGTRPMVMIFARQTGKPLAELVQLLDQTIADNQQTKLKGLVTLLGQDLEELKETANRLAESANVSEVPIAIASEQGVRANQYQLPEEADVTIVIAKDSRVLHTLTFDADEIDLMAVSQEIQQILR